MSQTDKTDRQDNKVRSSRWEFTAYENQWHLFREGKMPPNLAEWGWNPEKCPTTGRNHYQGYLRTKQQVRRSALVDQFPGVHFEVARNWQALKNYSSKEDTRIPGTEPVAESSTIPDIYAFTEIVGKAIPKAQEIRDMWEETRDIVRAETPRGVAPNYASKYAESLTQFLEHTVDQVVKQYISEGHLYAGHIAVNPQWISIWRKYGLQIADGSKLI